MTETDERTIETTARTYARTAAEAYGDAAATLRAIPETEWSGPTGCAAWDVRTLAGHIVGEAVWFANLTRGVTRHESPLPASLYESLKTLSPAELANQLQQAADAIPTEIEAAAPADLEEEVDLGWTRMPLWRATFVAMEEGVYHDWDLHVGRDPGATIPTPWARTLASGMVFFAPLIASPDGASASPGRYLLHIGDGVGFMTLTAESGHLTLTSGVSGTPDVTVSLTIDQYVRLIAGRLPLEHALQDGSVTIEGKRDTFLGLAGIFRSIGGGS